ncbi:hypothetical protein HA402_005757 [Bradysia odoriphaga]|nr:hypothetical protein HA402_005757 [Bradysia odoriphaga]
MAAPTVTLYNGFEMPVLGLGTWLTEGDSLVDAVKDAIDLGYRMFDTSRFYCNEKELGKGIRAKIREGVVRREDIVVITKLWNTHHDPDVVERACKYSCEELGLDYIDLYLMQSPMGYAYRGETDQDLWPENAEGSLVFSDVDYVDTYKAMEKLLVTGMVRNIGVSNFNSQQIDRLLANCSIKPVVNQVEVGPSRTQKKLIQFCMDRGIHIIGFSPLGRPHYAVYPDLPKLAFLDDRVIAIGSKYGKTGAQVVLRYLNQLGVALIPKSINQERLSENMNIFDFELNDKEMAVMETFNTGKRALPMKYQSFNFNHKYFPYDAEF